MNHLFAFIRRYSTAIAFSLVAIAAFWAINASANHTAKTAAKAAAVVLHQSEIQACHRSNNLRRAINSRTTDSEETRKVLISFIVSAEDARAAAYLKSHEPSDGKAAQAYKRDAARERKVHFPLVDIVNCPKAFPAP